jgi:hypothetical protein
MAVEVKKPACKIAKNGNPVEQNDSTSFSFCQKVDVAAKGIKS